MLVAALWWLPRGYGPEHNLWSGVLLGCAIITLVGALDDRFELHPALKLIGQIVAAVVVVHFGVGVRHHLPFFGHISLPHAGVTNGGPLLTVLGLVVMMNVVNFSDGVDGLVAGVWRSSPPRGDQVRSGRLQPRRARRPDRRRRAPS